MGYLDFHVLFTLLKMFLNESFTFLNEIAKFGTEYLQNHNKYHMNIFNNSYSHKSNYFKKVHFCMTVPLKEVSNAEETNTEEEKNAE